MKTVRTKKTLKAPIKKRRQRILAKAFGTDRERVKPFSEDDRGEDRKFKTSLLGFKYKEEEHEASGYLSRTLAMVTVSSKYQLVIPKTVRASLKLKPGQKVRLIEKDGVIRLVPIPPLKRTSRTSRRSERGSLPKLKPFVRNGKADYQSRLKQMLETPPQRLGEPTNPTPSKMKNVRKTR